MDDDQLLRELAVVHQEELKVSSDYALKMALYTFGADVLVNDNPKRVILENRKNRDGNERTIYCSLGDVEIGDIIKHKDQDWLLVNFPMENQVYMKSYLKRCNAKIPIPSGKVTQVETKKDWRGFPEYQQNTEFVLYSCVAESRIYQSDYDDRPINLPSGQLKISLQYTELSKVIRINYIFEMYGEKYQVVHVDRNQLVDGKGLLVLTCEFVN